MKNSLILYSCLALSCWSGPAVSPNYSFENVVNLEIERECNGEVVTYNVNKEVSNWKGDGSLDAFFNLV